MFSHPQTYLLTTENINAQINICARFWVEVFVLIFRLNYKTMTALKFITKIGNIQIFDKLLDIRADMAA